jgi:hypothetical protein
MWAEIALENQRGQPENITGKSRGYSQLPGRLCLSGG